MKNLLIFILLIQVYFGFGQVFLPDSKFKNELRKNYPDCFINGTDALDTIKTATKTGFLNLNDKQLWSIEGIQYFKSLNELWCSYNGISSLPKLPKSLKILSCGNNSIDSIGYLPDSLQSLTCYNNGLRVLSSLPKSLLALYCNNNVLKELPLLPDSLLYLECDHNQLTSIPNLPAKLSFLYCTNNELKSLPELPSRLESINCDTNNTEQLPILPTSLKYLSIAVNQLDKIPDLPPFLVELNCSRNGINSLPTLPNSLTHLYCGYNNLDSLPVLSSLSYILTCEGNNLHSLPFLGDSLYKLDCSKNHLTILPSLPSTLIELYVAENQVSTLKPLPPNLVVLDCKKTPLTCLPFLPPSLGYLYTDVKCLSNKPLFYPTLEANRIPLCAPTNNVFQCKSLPIIKGQVFVDENKNGLNEANEAYISGLKVFLSNDLYTFTYDSGYYELGVDTLGLYGVSAQAPSFYTSFSKEISLSEYAQVVRQDLTIQPNRIVKDLAVTVTNIGFVRPGFGLVFQIEVENKGTTTENAMVSFAWPSKYILDSLSEGLIFTGSIATEKFTGLHPGEKRTRKVYGKVLSDTPILDTLTFDASVNAEDISSDSVFKNNFAKLKLVVRGSFDPNDKQGPAFISPQDVKNGEYVYYTIRFQNTGTDTAFTVVVADTLEEGLIASTMELIGASHSCKTVFRENLVYFEFRNIFLADSFTNEPKSHGYVTFKIKPNNNLFLGSTFSNTASIYFDYNQPVVTNTVTTKVDEPLTLAVNKNYSVSESIIYPNPVENGILHVVNYPTSAKLRVLNILGYLVKKFESTKDGLDVSDLEKGVYLLVIEQESFKRVEKIIIR